MRTGVILATEKECLFPIGQGMIVVESAIKFCRENGCSNIVLLTDGDMLRTVLGKRGYSEKIEYEQVDQHSQLITFMLVALQLPNVNSQMLFVQGDTVFEGYANSLLSCPSAGIRRYKHVPSDVVLVQYSNYWASWRAVNLENDYYLAGWVLLPKEPRPPMGWVNTAQVLDWFEAKPVKNPETLTEYRGEQEYIEYLKLHV